MMKQKMMANGGMMSKMKAGGGKMSKMKPGGGMKMADGGKPKTANMMTTGSYKSKDKK